VDRSGQERSPQQVDRTGRASPVRDGGPHDPLEQFDRHFAPERPARPVLHQTSEVPRVVRSERNARTHPEPTGEIGVDPLDRLRGPRDRRPYGRNARLAFGEEAVGSSDRPKDRSELGAADANVVDDEHDRTSLSAGSAQEARHDLGHRETAPVEPFVQRAQERRGEPVGASGVGGSYRYPPGERTGSGAPDPIGDLPCGASGDRGRARSSGTDYAGEPRRRRAGVRGIEPTHEFGDLGFATEDDRRQPVLGEHFGMRGGKHEGMYFIVL
jgi:hypothetical protein